MENNTYDWSEEDNFAKHHADLDWEGANSRCPDPSGSAFERWWNDRLRECPDGRFIKLIAREAWDAAHSRQTFEVEKHKQVIRSIVQIERWMSDVNVDIYDKYKTALSERIEMAENLLSQNSED